MKIFVKVKPNAKIEKVEKIDDNNFIVSVKAPPTEGKANAAAENAIAKYLGVPASMVIIKSGHSSRKKVIEIFI